MKDNLKHGIEYATYVGGPTAPYFKPRMGCLCGWDTGRCENWEDAGRELDAHLFIAEQTAKALRRKLDECNATIEDEQ